MLFLLFVLNNHVEIFIGFPMVIQLSALIQIFWVLIIRTTWHLHGTVNPCAFLGIFSEEVVQINNVWVLFTINVLVGFLNFFNISVIYAEHSRSILKLVFRNYWLYCYVFLVLLVLPIFKIILVSFQDCSQTFYALTFDFGFAVAPDPVDLIQRWTFLKLCVLNLLLRLVKVFKLLNISLQVSYYSSQVIGISSELKIGTSGRNWINFFGVCITFTLFIQWPYFLGVCVIIKLFGYFPVKWRMSGFDHTRVNKLDSNFNAYIIIKTLFNF